MEMAGKNDSFATGGLKKRAGSRALQLVEEESFYFYSLFVV